MCLPCDYSCDTCSSPNDKYSCKTCNSELNYEFFVYYDTSSSKLY